MNIRPAAGKDITELSLYDDHISKNELETAIHLNRIFIAEEDGVFIGWLRYNLFWDNTPFMNMLYLLEGSRKKGYGKQLVEYWEKEMKSLRYDIVMTSTQSNEYSQHFYMKLGYQVIGGFILESEPFEIILSKKL